MISILKYIIFVMGLVGSNYPMKAEAITVAHSFLSHSINNRIMENQKEIWKDIPGYEDYYQVSNLGSVKSIKFNKEKILKQNIDGEGYFVVCLSKFNKTRTYTVHQLEAIAFLHHTPNKGTITIDHINNNKKDNRLVNLQELSCRENTIKTKRQGTTSKYMGVYWCKSYSKWRSTIFENKKIRHLGYFDNEHSAHLAYQKALKQITKI